MYRYRAGASSSASSSRATPTTRCQKCLKLGHYSFDCKSTTQERPYISRPSRTQQLFNPKLQQKLTEAVPPEEPSLANKKGTADGILKKKEQERELLRGRKRRRNSSLSPRRSNLDRRSRSRSSSVSSYSSISTTSSTHYHSSRNRSRNFDHARRPDASQPRRSLSRSASRSPDHERSVRRKYRDSPSPGKRGRRLSPTDYSRRTRSPSPRRRLRKSSTPQLALATKPSISPTHRRNSESGFNANGPRELPSRRSPSRERSMSPFTRRRLMTEAMRRG